MNKNRVIFVLAVLVVIGSIWGSIANKKKILLKDELAVKQQELQVVQKQNDQVQEQVLAKTADLQKDLQEKENKLLKGREELVALRRSIKGLEAKLSVRTAAISKLLKERTSLINQLKEKEKVTGKVASSTSGNDLAACQAKLKVAETNNAKLKAWLETKKQRLENLQKNSLGSSGQGESTAKVKNLQEKLEAGRQENSKLQKRLASADADILVKQAKMGRELDSARAQVIGLERIVEEKNDFIEDRQKELDRIKINMNVLLAKISDQQNSLQELQSETKQLVKNLAHKNAQISDLNEKVLRSPVR